MPDACLQGRGAARNISSYHVWRVGAGGLNSQIPAQCHMLCDLLRLFVKAAFLERLAPPVMQTYGAAGA